jgi:hypothetical protein
MALKSRLLVGWLNALPPKVVSVAGVKPEMPAIMTLGGIALAVMGLLIAFAGMPDRAAGLGLGSDLIQAGATIFAGGLVVAALGQVLKALQDVADRVDDAGFGLSTPKSLNDELAQSAPMPLPRAARNAPATASQDDDIADVPVASPARESRSQRAPQPAPRATRPAPQLQRPQPRPQARPAQQAIENFDASQHDDYADDLSPERQDARPEPRWMRAQAETSNRQQPAGVIPMQSTRAPRATGVAAVNPPRQAAPANAYDAEPRRRPSPPPQPEEIEPGEPTVVRSGIIAGMAYTLYSDRSIEAELPAGTVRFGSIEELQEHVKRAGVDEQEEYRGPSAAPH